MTTAQKTCFKCKMQKAHDAFYRHPAMSDGRLGKCIECTKADVAKHRAENLDLIREYDRARSSQPHRAELRNKITRRWVGEHADRRKAHSIVNYALRSGQIKKAEHCLNCGAGEGLEAHHPDYSRPLDVVWLCVPCHRQTHAMIKSYRIAA